MRDSENLFPSWVDLLIREGMKPFLLTFMFNSISGHPRAQLEQMNREIERAYAMLLTRIVRNPRSKNLGYLDRPIWLCSPDRPVRKRDKINLREVMVNDGLHVHGIALIPINSRLRDFEQFVYENQEMLANSRRPLLRFDARPITDTPSRATRYALKGLINHRFDSDTLLVLPRALSEMPSSG